MSERIQIGPKVDSDLWAEFRDDVQRRKGQTRGVLGDELENAIRQYIYSGDNRTQAEQLQRMNERLGRIEAAVGTAAADGGVDTSGADTHAHAPRRVSAETAEEKPAPNAPTADKVDYLTREVVDEYGKNDNPERVAIKRESLQSVITDAYDFGDRTLPKYVDRLIDRLELRPHPEHNHILLGTEEFQKVEEGLREQAEQQAEKELSNL